MLEIWRDEGTRREAKWKKNRKEKKKRTEENRKGRRKKRRYKKRGAWKRCRDFTRKIFGRKEGIKEKLEKKERSWNMERMGRWFFFIVMIGQISGGVYAASENAQNREKKMETSQDKSTVPSKSSSEIEQRMRKEEMEEQFNKEAHQRWIFAVSAARIIDEKASSEDRKHTSGGVFVAIDSNLGAVTGKEEGTVTSIPGDELLCGKRQRVPGVEEEEEEEGQRRRMENEMMNEISAGCQEKQMQPVVESL